MKTKFATVEVWILVDAAGDTATGDTAEDALERYEANVQPLSECGDFRLVRVKVRVPLPEGATVELAVEAPAAT